MLHVHRADRADALVEALAKLLAVVPGDPFEREAIAVPTRGVERWLTQTLSLSLGARSGCHDGILANVKFPSPRDVTDGAVAAACGFDPATDPWARDRLVWPLLEVVDAHLDDPWLTVLANHLRDSAGAGTDTARPRRLVAVRHIAQLFDRYAMHRPTMLRHWGTGEDVDGSGRPLGVNTAWQAELWRRARERIGVIDPVQRLDDATGVFTEPESSSGLSLDLPVRLSLFGLTRLPPAQLEVVRAIANHREVHLFLLHPSPALWAAVAATLQEDGQANKRRVTDPTAQLAQNPLLGSWGRDARELQLVLEPAADYVDHQLETVTSEPTTLLARLQADIRANRTPPGPPMFGRPDARPALEPGDRSVQLHSCHGRARQVEVLHDAILHVMQGDPTLEPRDVIVMCPDIEAFAPLIQATFGVGHALPAEHGSGAAVEPNDIGEFGARSPELRVRLADRAIRQTNSVLGAIAHLLDLADQRLTASQVLDLVDRDPIRRRFHLDDDDLVRLERWVADAEIRWGLDAAHRAPFRLDVIKANTWRFGLDRLLLGVTMTEEDERLVGGVLPLDDVESGAIDLAGRFAELLDRLQAIVQQFGERHTIIGWAKQLAAAADLLTETTRRDVWQRVELDRLLADLVENASMSDPEIDTTVDLAELRDLLDEHLRGRPTRANFRTGHLTFCTLAPMRSVPHRVVALLGLDDTVFPRKAPRDGDDLIVDDPHIGDHDGRTEDRQLLLDALLAAQDKLIIVYTGNDERTNVPRPPAVPVGELMETVDRTVHTDTGPAREAITVRHPLQPFDPRNFIAGELVGGTPFSFDPVTLEGARALTLPRLARPPFLAAPLPPTGAEVVELDDLVRFVQHPARAFLRQRFGISLGTFSDELDDSLPIKLDGLEQWAIGERMLRARMAGRTARDTVRAEVARGALPPGRLADQMLTAVGENVEVVASVAKQALSQTSDLSSLDIRVSISGGRLLSGTVAGLNGDCLQMATYSRVSPKHRLAAWVRLLALTAARPDRPFEAVTVGRAPTTAPRGSKATLVRIGPFYGDAESRQAAAVAHLDDLMDLFDRGMAEPPPLACAASAAYARGVTAGRDPVPGARNAWESAWTFDREDREPEHQQLYGGVVPFETLLLDNPRDDESGPGWDVGQSSRFGRWAVRLWTGVASAEDVSYR